MMSKCVYDNADLSSHGGAETEAIKMYDSDEPKCVSEHKSFNQNFPDCETFSYNNENLPMWGNTKRPKYKGTQTYSKINCRIFN